jgi:hypothetical protein
MEFDRFDNAIYTTEEIVAQLYESQEWADFRAKFDMNDEGNQTLFGLLIDEKLDPHPELADYQRLLRTVLAAGGVVRVQEGTQYEFELAPVVEPAIEPEVPRDKNGNVLSESQIRWSSYRQWSETHSSADCKARARTDADYGLFYRKNLEREAQGTESTQFKLAGQQPSKPNVSGVSPELIAFATEFKKTPMDRVRVLRNPSLSPLTFEKYNQQLEAAIAAGLV